MDRIGPLMDEGGDARMTFDHWLNAVEALDLQTSAATEAQHKLASAAGVHLDSELPTLVAAAILRATLSGELGFREPGPVTDSQFEFLEKLPPDPRLSFSPSNSEEASAWIRHLVLRLRRHELIRLELRRGDVVVTGNGTMGEVSSIGDSGRVYFAGGMGAGAWPDTLRVVARVGVRGEDSSGALAKARNAAALRRPAAAWSCAKMQDLADFEVDMSLTRNTVERFESIVDDAADEHPIQEFLQEHPALMARALLGASLCYCIPQKRLGSEYVPDFVVGDIDSLGVHWLLVELETPTSKLVTQTGELEMHARAGVKQIRDWRQWLTDNIGYARLRRAENGLGLYDISGSTPAVVVVGRRALSAETIQSSRLQHRDREQIAVHTYDWLIERAYSALTYTGMPALRSLAMDLSSDSFRSLSR